MGHCGKNWVWVKSKSSQGQVTKWEEERFQILAQRNDARFCVLTGLEDREQSTQWDWACVGLPRGHRVS